MPVASQSSAASMRARAAADAPPNQLASYCVARKRKMALLSLSTTPLAASSNTGKRRIGDSSAKRLLLRVSHKPTKGGGKTKSANQPN